MIPTAFAPLVTHLWQSTVFAAVAGLLTLALRRNQARVRYWLWLAASYKFLIPFSWLVSVGHQFEWRTAPAIVPSIMPLGFSAVTDAVSGPAFLTALPAAKPTPDHLPALLVAIWACGFAIVAYGWVREWLRIRAMVRGASPLPFDLPFDSRPKVGEILRFAQNDNEKQTLLRVVSTPARLEPGVFGILRPVLLLPEGIADRLTRDQLQAIIAHELCHVRRRDNLTAAIHMLVEALFWFHPLVWWMGAQLIDERERACDEEVLQAGSQAQVYAESILKVCEFYLESPLSCVSGVTGSDLKKRMQRIMKERLGVALSARKKLLLATAGVVALVVPVVAGVLTAPLRAQSTGSQSQQVKVGTITFQGNTVYSNRQLIRAMHDLRPYTIPLYLFNIPLMSKTFERRKLDEDLEAGIRAIYQDSGYFNVVVKNPILTTVNGGKTTNIMIAIEEGAQYRMGSLVFRSADPSKPLPINRETLEAGFTLKKGDIFDAEKVHQAMVGYTKLYGQSVTPHVDVNKATKTIDLTFDFGSTSQATRGAATGTGSVVTPTVAGNGFLQQEAQAPAAQSPATKAPAKQAGAARPEFEVASVKPCAPDAVPGARGGGGGGQGPSPDRLRMPCETVKRLITLAYVAYANGHFNSLAVSMIPIEGGPAWINSDLYEVEAKAENPEGQSMMNGPMLQALLEDRFKLKIHHEAREVPVYALTVTKNGPKLQPHVDGSCVLVDFDNLEAFLRASPPPAPGQAPPLRCGTAGIRKAGGQFEATGETLASLCEYFSGRLDRNVIDKTGIPGMFDINLDLSAEDLGLHQGPPDPTTDPEPSAVFAAVRSAVEKVGLKLDSTKGPGDFLVIDSVERPSPN